MKFFRNLFRRKKRKPLSVRRSGRTTRIIDNMVQQFFENGYVHVFDHHSISNDNLSRIQKIFLDRLKREHQIDKSMLSITKNKIVYHLKK